VGLLFVVEPLAGSVNVTFGATVSMVKVLGELVPVLPAASLWLA
jgi:hypothetical protein